MNYGEYLAHFNPNHDPRNGQFTGSRFGRIRPIDIKRQDKYNRKQKNPEKSENHKLRNGAIILGASLAVIGGYYLYKRGSLDKYISGGKDILHGAIDNIGSKKIPDAVTKKTSLKKLATPDTVGQAMKNTNPKFGNMDYRANCTSCSVAAFLRTIGYDVKAGKVPGGNGQKLENIVSRLFNIDIAIDDSRVLNDGSGSFASSPDKAARMLVRKFGNDADGVIGIARRSIRQPTVQDEATGHAFNFKIREGIVEFFDSQDPSGIRNDSWIRDTLWSIIDPTKTVTAFRLDGLDVRVDNALKELE